MTKPSNASGIVSLRLTPEERRLVEEAAKEKGWRVANFLRVSALERAAHVLNLSHPTSFDFSGNAKHLAHVLIAGRRAGFVWTEGGHPLGDIAVGQCLGDLDSQLLEDDVPKDVVGLADIQPAPLTVKQVEELNEAFRLGGAEFAAELLVECRRLLSGDSNLPAPIDPNNLKDKE